VPAAQSSCEHPSTGGCRENNIAHYPGFAVAGSTANVALQHRLGLLPERGPGSSSADRGDIGSDGPIIIGEQFQNL
jgi:hypothetical protein